MLPRYIHVIIVGEIVCHVLSRSMSFSYFPRNLNAGIVGIGPNCSAILSRVLYCPVFVVANKVKLDLSCGLLRLDLAVIY